MPDSILDTPPAHPLRRGRFFFPIVTIAAFRYGMLFADAAMSFVAPFVWVAMRFVDGGVVGRWLVLPIEGGRRRLGAPGKQDGRTRQGSSNARPDRNRTTTAKPPLEAMVRPPTVYRR